MCDKQWQYFVLYVKIYFNQGVRFGASEVWFNFILIFLSRDPGTWSE